MNEKKKTLILIGFFVILVAGASVLYNSLSKNYQPDTLLADENIPNTDSNKTGNHSTNSDNTAANETNSNAESTKNTSPEEDSSSENKNIAPNFTVYDLEGNEVNLTDFFGKPIIVNFWASWCGPCKMEMPDFNAAYDNYKNEIEFLMVNMTDGSRETLETASSFIKEQGYSFPVYYDTDYNAAITYSATSLPTTYFIDADGKLTAHAKGAIDADTLQRGIDMIYTR